ncbi:MAG: hypothetical protein KDC54_20295 [Lewinella sp.]|nr:hypothetical protein [Lewinella sp.]
MLKFFRRIRRRLLADGRIRSYLPYALGEILLVMVGILLALQVNNWNEVRKDRHTERAYLQGLHNDLQQDTTFLSRTLTDLKRRLLTFQIIDSTFTIKFVEVAGWPAEPYTWQDLDQLLQAPRTFRAKAGTYQALLADGQTKLITNAALLESIQNIYEVELASVEDIGKELWANDLRMEWSLVLKDQGKLSPATIAIPELTAQLHIYYGLINFYAWRIHHLRSLISESLSVLDKELTR